MEYDILSLQCFICFCYIMKRELAISIHISPPSCTSLPSLPSHPSKLSQSIKLCSLCCRAHSHYFIVGENWHEPLRRRACIQPDAVTSPLPDTACSTHRDSPAPFLNSIPSFLSLGFSLLPLSISEGFHFEWWFSFSLVFVCSFPTSPNGLICQSQFLWSAILITFKWNPCWLW